MKKVLLFAGMAALMAACSNEELVPNENTGGVNGAAKGIVFETAPLEETRGELTEGYNFFWYAEQDRINVYASNVAAAPANADGVGVAEDIWFSTIPNPAVYKATQSAGQGRFTAIDDNNWIQFANDLDVAVIATYPAGVTQVTSVQAWNNWIGWPHYINVTGGFNRVNIKTTVPAVQNVNYNSTIAPMLSSKVGHKRNAGYESVGEKLPLQFKRVYPIVKFSGVPTNDSFNGDLGILKSVTLEMMGGKVDDQHVLAPSKIAGDAVYPALNQDNKYNKTNTSEKVTVNLYSTWNSKDNIYMAILPVERIVNKVAVPEKMEVTYKYANATLVRKNVKALLSSNNWTEENSVVPMETLDIETMYPWIVTNPDADGYRKLIVNKGNFADAFTNNNNDIKWNGATVPVSEITKVEIRANVANLNNEDFKKLNDKFIALKELKIKNNTTTVPYNALNKRNALEYLEMTNVTNIQYQYDNGDRNMPINSNTLKTVIMPSYDFSTNRQLTQSILNKSALIELDMRGVASMKEAYPKDGMSLKGYTLLQTVHVQDNVVLGPESFYGCFALNYVDGYVQLGGYGAFQNCTSLEWVRINESTKIYDYTFSGAISLNNVMKSNWSGIQPTEIGVSAFENANSLENIDLTATVTIKSGAFKGATSLKGIEDKSKGLYALTVNAATIGSEAFSGCISLQYIYFNNLTKVEKGLLEGANLYELKFAKVVTFGAGVNTDENNAFGTTNERTKLFINPAQAYEGKKLYLGKTGGSNSHDAYKTFVTIIEE